MTVLIASTSAPQKGRRPASSRSIFVWSSSVSMVSSPTLVRSRSIVSSRSSRARDFRLAAAASRNASRQPLRSAAVTASSRATISSGSPRRSRSTASPLAARRHPPLPARSRDRSDTRGLRVRGSSALDVIHQHLHRLNKPSEVSQGTLGRGSGFETGNRVPSRGGSSRRAASAGQDVHPAQVEGEAEQVEVGGVAGEAAVSDPCPAVASLRACRRPARSPSGSARGRGCGRGPRRSVAAGAWPRRMIPSKTPPLSEATATEDDLAALGASVAATPARERRRAVRRPFPAHLPRERLVVPAADLLRSLRVGADRQAQRGGGSGNLDRGAEW